MTDTEATVQDNVRLDCAQNGGRLWRNNSGAAFNKHGRMIKFGLASDVPKVRSSDLIGITPVIIQPHHVGGMFGVFTAPEIKHGGWAYSGSEHEVEQLNFINMVRKAGGFAGFAASVDDYHRIIMR